jgi:putative hydrolase of the HAD superfamily
VQQPTVAVVRELREAGLGCHLATNQNDVRAAYLLGDLGYADLFDEVFCSCEIGATKDEPRFFEVVGARLGLPLSELLLVDDGESYVDCARALGMRAVHWCVDDGVDALRRLQAAEGLRLA